MFFPIRFEYRIGLNQYADQKVKVEKLGGQPHNMSALSRLKWRAIVQCCGGW